MHIIFPNSMNSGVELLILRKNILDWSQRSGIGYCDYCCDHGWAVELPTLQHYSQFVLQWEHENFYIAG